VTKTVLAPIHRLRWLDAVTLVAAALAIVAVDPVREFLAHDDSWAYARMVRHLLTTGVYALDAWSAANLPVQTGIAAAAASVFGYSITLLRVTTLVTWAIGLWSFRALLRELQVDATRASLVTLAMLANPIAVLLAFTFMSDLPYVSWMLLALWQYARAWNRGSMVALLAGSFASACAIGTRQFGVALPMALLLLGAPLRRRFGTRGLLVALALPAIAVAWQVQSGWSLPNYTQAFRLEEQRDYLAAPFGTLAHELAWRLTTTVCYLGIGLLGMLPLLVSDARRLAVESKASAASRSLSLSLALAVALAGVVLTWWPSVSTIREPGVRSLQLPWLLPTNFHDHPLVMRALAAMGWITGPLWLHATVRTAALWVERSQKPNQKFQLPRFSSSLGRAR